jgi:hypothetical protein
MAASNRAPKINKIEKVIKKHFKAVKPPADRTVMEHLLFACLLEDARHDKAEEAFAKLQDGYFDWNEIRVTTVQELADLMNMLPDPLDAATRLRRSLHSMFESRYAFDMEELKKANLGVAVKEIEGYKGVTPFVSSYMAQHALGGHSIPLGKAELDLMLLLDIISEKEAEKGSVPGLERTIPKSKGQEFAYCLHELAAEYYATPHSKRVRAMLLEIDSGVKDRFPKRTGKSKDESDAEAEAAPVKKKATKKAAAKATKKTTKKSAKKTKTAKKSTSKGITRKKPR